ncbi:hypothetical protein SNE40_007170 [Patella caerulea]|uniref:Uncharacterized protein n=1 Tax=Patella caerulea TaxID=87958 RepID=A0AAN8K322_PATCE
MSSHSPLIEKVHNFGIYIKKSKRAIFQLDFPGKSFYIIQRGHIKKNYGFDKLQHYDSEEGCHLVLKFLDSEIEFDTDNSEEKYTICRLLSLITDGTPAEYVNTAPDSDSLSLLPPVKIRQERILKDGLLEKKGNTTITTWNKRRVKVSPGEFSYFKPGEDLALNIVQIWDGICQIKRISSTGFSLTIRDERTYSFRCIGDPKQKLTAEDDREEWVKVLERAIKTRRNTLVYLDNNIGRNTSIKSKPDNIYEMATAVIGNKQDTPATQFASDINQHQVNQFQPRAQEITAHLSVSVSYVGTSDPTSDRTQQQSNQSSPDPIRSRKVPIMATSTTIPIPVTSSESPRSPQPYPSEANIYSTAEPIPTNKSSNGIFESSEGNVSSARAMFEDKIKVLADADGTDTKTKRRSGSPQEPKQDSPQTNGVPQPAIVIGRPAPPPPPPPAPAPLLKVKKAGVKLTTLPSVKLKPAHWTKISNNVVSGSIWKTMHDVTKNLDLSLLEEQFAMKEKETSNGKEPKEGGRKSKELLLDPKRAHILGIIVNGMKITGNDNMLELLSTMTETSTFPAETLSTIRSCQPTDDDKEMYKAYKGPVEKLLPVDKFMKNLCEIPYIGLRLELTQTIWEFPRTYDAVQEEVEDIWIACDELVGCSKLVKILEYILAIGNLLNSKWSSGYGVQGFEITSIDKVIEVKGKDHHLTVLSYLVNTLRAQDEDLLDWTSTLKHVSCSAEYSVKAIGAEIEVLKNDLQKVKKNMKVLKPLMTSNQDKQFQTDVQNFVTEHEKGLNKLDAKAIQLTHKYNRTLEMFGEKSDRPSDVFFSSISRFMEKFEQARDKRLK